MSEYPKVIRVGMLSVVVESPEEEARYLGKPDAPPVIDDVSPEPEPVKAPELPVEDLPKKKSGAFGSKKK